MNISRLFSSGSRLARRICTAAESEASSSDPLAPAAAATLSRSHHRVYKSLSALGSTGGTVAQALNQFVMEGKPVRKDELVRCVRELRKYRRHQHALEVYDWMEKRKTNFSITDHAIRLDLLAKTKGVEAAENYFSALPSSTKNQFTYGSLLNCYCMELMNEKAETHFQKMEELGLVTNSLPFNNMMGMYMRLGQPKKVPAMVDAMQQRNIAPCAFTYAIWMQSYGSLNDLEGVEKVLEEMEKDSEDKCTWNTYANLAAIYIKAGLYEKAELALKSLEEKMRPRYRESYHFLLSLYAGTSNLSEVYRVWDALKTALPDINNTSYLVMLQALSKLKDIDGIKKIYMEWESRCLSYDMRMANLVVRNYLEYRMYEEAVVVFENATKRCRGPFSKTRDMLMIYLLKNNEVDLALKHLEAAVSEKKERDDWKWSRELVEAFFDYFIRETDVDGAEEFCRGLKKFKSLDSNAYCLLLKTYVAAGKTAPDMRERLEKDEIETNDELENLLSKVCD